jgi:hypothetical protein
MSPFMERFGGQWAVTLALPRFARLLRLAEATPFNAICRGPNLPRLRA